MKKQTFATISALTLSGLSFAWQQTPVKLPPPFHTPNASNGAKVIEKPDTARLQVPSGKKLKNSRLVSRNRVS